MGRKQKVKVGDWFGDWRVSNIADVEQTGTNRKVLCECSKCGHSRLVFVNNLLSGMSTRCGYCRDRRSPDMNRYGHPRICNVKVDTVIGALTVTKVLADTAKQRSRRTIAALCLCGNTVVRRVDVIRRDAFPTCHHCRENGTLYRWPLADHTKILDSNTMDAYANGQECRWFDMMSEKPVEHRTAGYENRLKRNEKGISSGPIHD